MKKYTVLLSAIFILFLQSSCFAQKVTSVEKSSKQQLKDWTLESSTQVSEKESVISSASFNDKNWTKAKVPTTVLRALVNAGVYPHILI